VSARRGLIACAIAIAMTIAPALAAAQAMDPAQHAQHSRQANVHANAHEVMPFEIGKVEHVFRMSETGGAMRVVLRDAADTDQLDPIRTHLKEQAGRFAAGDFGAPSHLHGPAMPGLAELTAGAANVRVVYAELPDGAEIRFEASDIATITAIHRWFGAQLSEHAADARAE
jgi:hypothetical protein